MAAKRYPAETSSLAARPDWPLIGIALVEDGEEVVRYFADETDADAAVAHVVVDRRSLAGVWADLAWDDAVATLDRIRRDSAPAPPIAALCGRSLSASDQPIFSASATSPAEQR
ncbi:MAG: hypothetical protein IT338_02190 [Thermomicrobiales bacterium]|nr:hypothetical protein [Thermomicrobiales bacterium]